MKNSKTTAKDVGLLFLRLGLAGAMLTHGLPKLQKLLGDEPINFADPFGIGAVPTLLMAVLGEVLAPLFVIVGYKTRLASIFVAVTMGVAFFIIHAGDSFADREMAFVYFVGFVALFFLGGGKLGLSGAIYQKRTLNR